MAAALPPLTQDRPTVLTVWPRSVQRATVALMSLATAWLVVHSFSHFRQRLWPTELPRVEAFAYQVDLNHAERAELLQLPGVGEAMMKRILDYRSEHGGFQRVEDLRRVRGIGPLTFEKLRPWVYVSEPEEPSRDEDSTPQPLLVAAAPASQRKAAPITKKLTAQDARLDPNQASAEELQRLPGIGPRLAAAIVAAREQKPFASVDDLRRVKGIGPKTLEKVRPFVMVGSGELRLAAKNN